MKKIICFSISFLLLFFSIPFFAISLNASAQDVQGLVLDPGNYLTDEENRRVTEKTQDAVDETGMNIIIYMCDDVGYDKSDYGVMDLADVTYEQICGIDTDGILLLINLDNDYDYISTSGVAINYFSDNRIESMFDWFTEDIVDGVYESACNHFVDSVLYYYRQGKANNQTVSGNEKADHAIVQGMQGRVIDPGKYLTDEEKQRVMKKAQDAVFETGMNIIIYICDDVGYDKSDYGVMDLADVMYEEVCGIDTDGILLLINLDNDYDYISTSGVAINYFSDSRIDSMFNWFTRDIKNQDYESACNNFIESVLYYYHQGKANYQSITIDYEYGGMNIEGVLIIFGFPLFIAFIVGIIIYVINRNKYSLQKASTAKYIVSGSMLLNQNTDTYIGTIVNRIYSPRSSSSGGGGGSSHSSTHRSSGGGHHGGGGHHR